MEFSGQEYWSGLPFPTPILGFWVVFFICLRLLGIFHWKVSCLQVESFIYEIAFHSIFLPYCALSVMLDRRDENRHSCLVPDLAGKAFRFSPLNIMLVVGLPWKWKVKMLVSHVRLFVTPWAGPIQPTRLLCSWSSPGKNAGMGCHFLLQGIFLTQGSNLSLLHCRWILYCLSQQQSPTYYKHF